MRLGHQDIAIGQHIERARIFEVLGEDIDRQPGRDFRPGAAPADIGDDFHRRQQILVERRQIGMRADLAARIARLGAAGGKA